MNLEEIRNKKLQELQNQPSEEEQLEKLKKDIIRKYLTREAIERLGRVRLGHPDIAQQAELVILQAAQVGQLRQKIGDKELRSILAELSSGKKEFKFI